MVLEMFWEYLDPQFRETICPPGNNVKFVLLSVQAMFLVLNLCQKGSNAVFPHEKLGFLLF